uniref:TNFR-Cys domain-containing protein n=1 Tax=Callorhinchus milii TaxID=7868 RepID=A0A4W3JG92_CALMI
MYGGEDYDNYCIIRHAGAMLICLQPPPQPLVDVMTVDDCQEHEYWAEGGNCVACKECGAGLELSQDCGFGTGGDGQCVRCGHNRYKETWGFGKCKRCLSCSLFNRLQKSNCTALSNSVCGDCLVG